MKSGDGATQVDEFGREVAVGDDPHRRKDLVTSAPVATLVEQAIDRHTPHPRGRIVVRRESLPLSVGGDERLLDGVSSRLGIERDRQRTHGRA